VSGNPLLAPSYWLFSAHRVFRHAGRDVSDCIFTGEAAFASDCTLSCTCSFWFAQAAQLSSHTRFRLARRRLCPNRSSFGQHNPRDGSTPGFPSNAAAAKRAPHCKQRSQYSSQRIGHSVGLLSVGMCCMCAEMSKLGYR
jgi:hypothetical protein